jgi:hypothetical protein
LCLRNCSRINRGGISRSSTTTAKSTAVLRQRPRCRGTFASARRLFTKWSSRSKPTATLSELPGRDDPSGFCSPAETFRTWNNWSALRADRANVAVATVSVVSVHPHNRPTRIDKRLPNRSQKPRKFLREFRAALCRLSEANKLFADQVVKSALHTEPSPDAFRGLALQYPDLLATHSLRLNSSSHRPQCRAVFSGQHFGTRKRIQLSILPSARK